jgi:hypothetical protein
MRGGEGSFNAAFKGLKTPKQKDPYNIHNIVNEADQEARRFNPDLFRTPKSLKKEVVSRLNETEPVSKIAEQIPLDPKQLLRREGADSPSSASSGVSSVLGGIGDFFRGAFATREKVDPKTGLPFPKYGGKRTHKKRKHHKKRHSKTGKRRHH